MIEIIDGYAVVSKEAMSLPLIKKIYARDKAKGKKTFEMWMRFVYHSYDRRSLYKNYLPVVREKKVLEMVFPDKTVSYFKQIPGMKEFIAFYIESTYTFKEVLYRRMLHDIEELMSRLSKIELTKTSRVKGMREVSFFSKELKKTVTENVDLDVRISFDNSEEKIKAMDLIEKLLKREAVLKKALKEEEVERDLKKESRRLFDS